MSSISTSGEQIEQKAVALWNVPLPVVVPAVRTFHAALLIAHWRKENHVVNLYKR